MKMKVFLVITICFLGACAPQSTTEDEKGATLSKDLDHNWKDEIIYHVMQRSFYDSNGDLHGDLRGFVEKLDYLQNLGVTTILFTPLYESGFYHNYFPTDYEKIDPEYGTMDDYVQFVEAVHEKGMKFLMDMETQYAQSGHKWFDDSYQNPDSEFSDFIYYSDSLNQFPEQIFMPTRSPLHDFNAWPGLKHNIVFLDLNNSKVKEWMSDFYSYWVDPNGDGDFKDGVDGFRIDHIMDDLDNKGLFTNMYRDFWRPIFNDCKSINPNLFVLGEQSDWNEYGEHMVQESGADAAFNFQLLFALSGEEGTHDMYSVSDPNGVKMDPVRIHKVIEESMSRFSDSTYTVNFLENHDTKRWASVVAGNEKQKRIAAVFNLLLPGVPSIYYGQELGVPGEVHEWGSDANHIPVREAFPWTENPDSPGTALFYKNTGEWWDQSFHNSEAIQHLALSVQQSDEQSLWNHYRALIQLRKSQSCFRYGNYEPLTLDHPELMAFKRKWEEESFLVVLNLSEKSLTHDFSEENDANMTAVLGGATLNENGEVKIQAGDFGVFKLNG